MIQILSGARERASGGCVRAAACAPAIKHQQRDPILAAAVAMTVAEVGHG